MASMRCKPSSREDVQAASGAGAEHESMSPSSIHLQDTMGHRKAQSRSYLYTLGPKVGTTYILGAPGIDCHHKEHPGRFQSLCQLGGQGAQHDLSRL